MFKLTLPRRRLLPRVWKFPQISLPECRMRVNFPEKVPPPWKEIEVDRVIFAPLKPDTFMVRVIF